MATDLLPSQVVLINPNTRLISTPNVHFVFENEDMPEGLPADKVLFVDLDKNGSLKSYHASKVNQIYSAQISAKENERVLQIEGNFVASGSEENRSGSANPMQEHILKDFDTRNEFLRSLLRDAQTQNLFSMDTTSSSDSISSVEDAWRELEDKLNSTANDVELRLSTPEDIHRYLEQSIDELDLESESSQIVIPESFNDDLDWMSEASNESGHLNLASSTDEGLEEFRALSPELRPTSPFRTSESTTPVLTRRTPSPFAKRALFNLEAFS